MDRLFGLLILLVVRVTSARPSVVVIFIITLTVVGLSVAVALCVLVVIVAAAALLRFARRYARRGLDLVVKVLVACGRTGRL